MTSVSYVILDISAAYLLHLHKYLDRLSDNQVNWMSRTALYGTIIVREMIEHLLIFTYEKISEEITSVLCVLYKKTSFFLNTVLWEASPIKWQQAYTGKFNSAKHEGVTWPSYNFFWATSFRKRLTNRDAVLLRLTYPDVCLSMLRSKGGKVTCIVVCDEITDRSTKIRTANPIKTEEHLTGLKRMIHYDHCRSTFAHDKYDI